MSQNRIPPELDGLMWTLAEEQNENAITEFERRYPNFRAELLRRRRMVDGLRASRVGVAPVETPRVPKFSPRETRPAPVPSRSLAIVGGLVVAALAVAAYTATIILSGEPTATAPIVANQSPRTDVTTTEPQPPIVAPENAPQAPQQDVPRADPPAAPEPRWAKPQSLHVKRAGLVETLRLLGAQAGLRVEIAPGMPNPEIGVDYDDMSAIDILQDLGRQHGFTPFDQGDGTVVIYPAVEQPQNPTSRIGG